MFVELELAGLFFLALAGFIAAFVDAIAGGGGLISLPALLSIGLPPVAALATNKMQSIIGTTVAAFAYGHKGYVQFRKLIVPIGFTFIGSVAGAFTARSIDLEILDALVPILLIAIALYFMLSPEISDNERHERLKFARFVPVAGIAIGYYDGIFGPGTGSFFIAAFVTLFGLGVTRAVGNAKVLNAVSNAAALMFFGFAGDVNWIAGGAMVFGQIIGGYLGARTGMRFGTRLIKPLVVTVSIGMAMRLLWPLFSTG